MINLLFDPLPECVQVDGVDYPVVTDFRDWIAFADLILDPGISQQDKVAAAMQWYPDARPPDATKALHALEITQEERERNIQNSLANLARALRAKAR